MNPEKVIVSEILFKAYLSKVVWHTGYNNKLHLLVRLQF